MCPRTGRGNDLIIEDDVRECQEDVESGDDDDSICCCSKEKSVPVTLATMVDLVQEMQADHADLVQEYSATIEDLESKLSTAGSYASRHGALALLYQDEWRKLVDRVQEFRSEQFFASTWEELHETSSSLRKMRDIVREKETMVALRTLQQEYDALKASLMYGETESVKLEIDNAALTASLQAEQQKSEALLTEKESLELENERLKATLGRLAIRMGVAEQERNDLRKMMLPNERLSFSDA